MMLFTVESNVRRLGGSGGVTADLALRYLDLALSSSEEFTILHTLDAVSSVDVAAWPGDFCDLNFCLTEKKGEQLGLFHTSFEISWSCILLLSWCPFSSNCLGHSGDWTWEAETQSMCEWRRWCFCKCQSRWKALTDLKLSLSLWSMNIIENSFI